MRTLKIEPLTKEAFALFGDVDRNRRQRLFS